MVVSPRSSRTCDTTCAKYRAALTCAATASAPTLALSQIKRQFDANPGQSLTDALDFEAAVQALMTNTEDFKEGTLSFREKRKPDFRQYAR